MSINILMPALSPTMTEGKLAKWHVKVGDTVKSGQVVCEIETDKATMEVEAVDEGKVGQILVEEGTEGVKVNAVIAVLLEEGEKEAAKSAAPAAATAPKAEEKPAEKPVAPAPKPAAQPAASSGGARIFASPLAKRIAAEKGIDLAGLKGHRLRTHGGTSETQVPFILNRPLNEAYRDKVASESIKSWQIFDFAINGTV